jgi:hypothetical protein
LPKIHHTQREAAQNTSGRHASLYQKTQAEMVNRERDESLLVFELERNRDKQKKGEVTSLLFLPTRAKLPLFPHFS